MRRNKAAFAGVAAVVAALVLGLGLSLYLFIQERHALQNERAALGRAVAAERRQAELREQAEKGLALEKQFREMVPITEKFYHCRAPAEPGQDGGGGADNKRYSTDRAARFDLL